jgi:HSP20 family protein
MRFRHVFVSYTFGSASQSLERHYRELRDDLLRQGHHYGLLQPSAVWRPPVDIHETATLLSVKMELAGVQEENLDITLYDNALVVTGRREDEAEHDEPICYHEAQVHYGPFRAEVLLPLPVQHDAVTAVYENGFLRVRLPKMEPSAPGSWRSGETREEITMADTKGHLNAAAVEPAATTGPLGSAGASGGSHPTPPRRLV